MKTAVIILVLLGAFDAFMYWACVEMERKRDHGRIHKKK